MEHSMHDKLDNTFTMSDRYKLCDFMVAVRGDGEVSEVHLNVSSTVSNTSASIINHHFIKCACASDRI